MDNNDTKTTESHSSSPQSLTPTPTSPDKTYDLQKMLSALPAIDQQQSSKKYSKWIFRVRIKKAVSDQNVFAETWPAEKIRYLAFETVAVPNETDAYEAIGLAIFQYRIRVPSITQWEAGRRIQPGNTRPVTAGPPVQPLTESKANGTPTESQTNHIKTGTMPTQQPIAAFSSDHKATNAQAINKRPTPVDLLTLTSTAVNNTHDLHKMMSSLSPVDHKSSKKYSNWMFRLRIDKAKSNPPLFLEAWSGADVRYIAFETSLVSNEPNAWEAIGLVIFRNHIALSNFKKIVKGICAAIAEPNYAPIIGSLRRQIRYRACSPAIVQWQAGRHLEQGKRSPNKKQRVQPKLDSESEPTAPERAPGHTPVTQAQFDAFQQQLDPKPLIQKWNAGRPIPQGNGTLRQHKTTPMPSSPQPTDDRKQHQSQLKPENIPFEQKPIPVFGGRFFIT